MMTQQFDSVFAEIFEGLSIRHMQGDNHHGAALKACLIVTAGCLHHLDFYFCPSNTVHRTFHPIVKDSADLYCQLLTGVVKAPHLLKQNRKNSYRRSCPPLG
jgi:hypothetical protein